MRPGQEAGERPGVVAPTVAVGKSAVLGQAGEDQEVVLEGGERLEDLGQDQVRAGGLGRPVGHVDAVGNIKERHPVRRARRSAGHGGRDQGPHRFEPRQGHRGAQASEDRPS